MPRRANEFELSTIDQGARRDGGGLDTQMVAAWLIISLVEEVREYRKARQDIAAILDSYNPPKLVPHLSERVPGCQCAGCESI